MRAFFSQNQGEFFQFSKKDMGGLTLPPNLVARQLQPSKLPPKDKQVFNRF